MLLAPLAPVATAATGVTGVVFTANWNPSAGAVSYAIDVSTDAAFATLLTGFANLSTGSATTASVMGLTCANTYHYRVRATNAAGTSPDSNVIAVSTPICPPGPPVATAGTGPSISSLVANWNAVTGATSYQIDVGTDIGGFASFLVNFRDRDVGAVTSVRVTGLNCGSTYYYRVRASNASGTSKSSNIITAGTVVCAPPPPVAMPANIGIGATVFIANWNASAGATAYFLDVATDAGFSMPVAGYSNLFVGSSTSRVVSGLSLGVTYYYRLRASNLGGTSGNSNTITVTPDNDEGSGGSEAGQGGL